MVRGSENFEFFSKSLSGVLDEVNSLILCKEIMVEEKRIHLRFVLGSDYKVKKVKITKINN